MTDWISAIATACAAIIIGWELFQSKRIAQATFEDSLDQQYRELVKEIPVPVLLGEPIPDAQYVAVRELIYNYLDLCNEQAFLWSRKRISRRTWESWQQGMSDHMGKPGFRKVYDEVKAAQPNGFSYINFD